VAATMAIMLPLSNNQPGSKGSTEAEAVIAEFKERAAEIYSAEFTEAELTDILAFYRSPSGARYLEKQSTIDKQLRHYLFDAPAPRK
jgi:hypothetical protein